jgi:hypothetical protein
LLASLAAIATARPGGIGGGGGFGGVFGGSGFGGSGGGLDTYSAPPSGGGAPSGGYGAPVPQYGPPAQAPVIHKHVYVHVPPPEPTYYAPKKTLPPPPPPQKHYKIVFIKAPTPPPPTVPDIPALPPPDEQKTLIYVLVKKPEDAPEIHIPTPAPTKPSKPEVYFIRYKTQVSDASSATTKRRGHSSPSLTITVHGTSIFQTFEVPINSTQNSKYPDFGEKMELYSRKECLDVSRSDSTKLTGINENVAIRSRDI